LFVISLRLYFLIFLFIIGNGTGGESIYGGTFNGQFVMYLDLNFGFIQSIPVKVAGVMSGTVAN